uniref:L-lactate dehydrogenase complex protein LldG n=1 Tax=Candidatus Kentrum sp. FW TaxID=2126338 RepID=A0A450TF93_9GAMM|nr:MAG: L-lactate dehydrogenase complex protein LldG [Candidatus Kentron sp. FW]
MTNARSAILSRVRTSLEREGETLSRSVQETLEKRLSAPPATVRPAIPEEDITRRFVMKLEAVAGRVVHVPKIEEVPQAILGHLDRHRLPRQLVATRDPILADIPWPKSEPEQITLHYRTATRTDQVSLTCAFSAIAETGTMVLVSGQQTPTTLNFLPEDHIVVLPEDRIVPHMEDVWEKIRATFTSPPRTINLITGPSRTGDIEQTMQLGAHGPRRLTVILVTHHPS